MIKIKQVSFYFSLLFKALFVAIPLMQVIGWVMAPNELHLFNHIIQFKVLPRPYEILHTLTFVDRSLGFCVSLIPTSVDLFFLYCLIKLFSHFEKGDVFSLKNVTYIRNAGYALLIGQVLNPIYTGLMGVVITMGNPPGHRFASVTFDQTNLGIIILALLIILISWILAEGYHLREEQQLTV